MATIGPVAITTSWTKVYDGNESGEFSGGIQASAANPVCVRVSDGNVSPTIEGGFMLGSEIYPISIAATQALWARVSGGSGTVTLG
jgi:hypothetical protein